MTLLANMIELVAECCVLGFLGISCVTFGAGAQLISMCKYHVSLLRAPPQGSSPWRPCSWPTPASSTWASTLSASAATRRRGRRWRSQPGPPSSGEQAAGGALCAEDTSPTPPTTKSFHSTARVKSSSLTMKLKLSIWCQQSIILLCPNCYLTASLQLPNCKKKIRSTQERVRSACL